MRVQIRENAIEIEGYVNAVCRDSRQLADRRGKFVEQIEAGAWQRALDREEEVKMLFNHDNKRELGSTKQNVELWEDNIGLKVRATITDEEVIECAKNNKLTGFSFGFYANKQRYEPIKEGLERRYVEDLKLTEVSLLSKTPAYFGTQVELRGDETVIREFRSIEDVQDHVEPPKEEQREEPPVIDYTMYEIQKYILEKRGN